MYLAVSYLGQDDTNKTHPISESSCLKCVLTVEPTLTRYYKVHIFARWGPPALGVLLKGNRTKASRSFETELTRRGRFLLIWDRFIDRLTARGLREREGCVRTAIFDHHVAVTRKACIPTLL